MVDQVSLTAVGGLSASRNKKLMNFLPCGARPACGLKNEGNKIDVWYLSNLVFSALLAICPWFCAGSRDQGRTARERSNNGDIQIRD